MFCLPFIVVLSLSGAIYLFKPQIDAYLDRPYDHLALAEPVSPLDEQVEAALAANPTARIKGLQLRDDPTDAARVHLMTRDGQELRVMVRPDTLEILKTEAQKGRFTNFIHDLHGELLVGEPGAIAVELAGAWAIVMVITGLYLWWPRWSAGLAGVLYPRLGGGRRFFRDLHAVTGMWLSFFALFYLISALPWTKFSGEELKYVQGVLANCAGYPGIGRLAQRPNKRNGWRLTATRPRREAKRRTMSTPNIWRTGEHSEHADHAGHRAKASRLVGFDELAAQVAPLHLADPVLISPPSAKKPNWIVRSDAQNRTLRATLEFDPKNFEQVKAESFADRAWLIASLGSASPRTKVSCSGGSTSCSAC